MSKILNKSIGRVMGFILDANKCGIWIARIVYSVLYALCAVCVGLIISPIHLAILLYKLCKRN